MTSKFLNILIIILLTFFTMGCEDIFTSNVLEGLKSDVMNDSRAKNALYGSSAEVNSAIEYLEGNVSPLTSSSSQADIDEALLLADLKAKRADIEGAIEDLLDDSIDTENFLDNLVADSARLNDLEEASDLIVNAYLVSPDSVTDTQLIIGGAGLVGDILSDPILATELSSVVDYNTLTPLNSGFTAEQIENIQTADAMFQAIDSEAREKLGLSGGLPF